MVRADPCDMAPGVLSVLLGLWIATCRRHFPKQSHGWWSFHVPEELSLAPEARGARFPLL